MNMSKKQSTPVLPDYSTKISHNVMIGHLVDEKGAEQIGRLADAHVRLAAAQEAGANALAEQAKALGQLCRSLGDATAFTGPLLSLTGLGKGQPAVETKGERREP